MRRPSERVCAHCGRLFMAVCKETRLCSRSCVNYARRMPTLADRFHAHVKRGRQDECWPWTGHSRRRGYGQMKWTDGRHHAVARIAWELANGRPIAPNMHACHHCDNPPCCNPAHIFVGTAIDNVRDRDAKRRTSMGENHHAAKLTLDQAKAIREDKRLLREIAADYGVSFSVVSAIRRGKKWRRSINA